MNKNEKNNLFEEICQWLTSNANSYAKLEYLPDEDCLQPYLNTEKMVKDLKKHFDVLTKEDKRKMFAPKQYALFENGVLVSIYDSHKAAKKARYISQKQANAEMLDLDYVIKPVIKTKSNDRDN